MREYVCLSIIVSKFNLDNDAVTSQMVRFTVCSEKVKNYPHIHDWLVPSKSEDLVQRKKLFILIVKYESF